MDIQDKLNQSLYSPEFSPVTKTCCAEPSPRPKSQPEHSIHLSTMPPSPHCAGQSCSQQSPVCPSLGAPTAWHSCLVPLPCEQLRAPSLGSNLRLWSRLPSRHHGGQVLLMAGLPSLVWTWRGLSRGNFMCLVSDVCSCSQELCMYEGGQRLGLLGSLRPCSLLSGPGHWVMRGSGLAGQWAQGLTDPSPPPAFEASLSSQPVTQHPWLTLE